MNGRRSDITALAFACIVVFALLIAGRELTAIGIEARRSSWPASDRARASALTPHDWRRLRDLASFEQLTGNLGEARRHYEAAIEVFPNCPSCWIGLAETLHASGHDPSAALAEAISNGRSSTRVRTRAAVLYERMGLRDQALKEFRAVIGGRRDDKRDFYELLHRIYASDVIVEQVVPPTDHRGYFAFARARLAPSEVEAVWARWSDGLGEAARRDYLDYLIKHDMLHRAWRIVFGPGVPIGVVPNGDFEAVIDVADPFAWRLRDTVGVVASVVDCDDCSIGAKTLRLKFDGEHDPHYVGAVIRVPVEAGASYRLRAAVKTVEITSAVGPALAVTGLAREPQTDCRFRAATEGFRLTRPWRVVSLEFRVPDGCEGLRIFVERRPANAVNRLIGGEFYIDDVRLERLPGR